MQVHNGCVILGRKLEWFYHGSCEKWGYAKKQTDTFALLHPKNENDGEKYPLYVVFHSSGHNVYSAVSCIETEGNHDIYRPPENMFGLFLDCYENRENDWWWGGINPRDLTVELNSESNTKPVENRIIDTVKHVVENFQIDKNRIYAVGNSMGGSGALSIAMNHGDIFAAVIANVPAGVKHALKMLKVKENNNFEIPDLPIVVDYSAQNDVWSIGHEKLYKFMQEKKYAIIGYWGPFGHENNYKKILTTNDLVLCFNPLNIKLNEAYPAFTNTTADDTIPWPDNTDSKGIGQINAFFVWQNISDFPDKFEMSIRLLRKEEWKTVQDIPTSVETYVTLRRVQNFLVSANEEYLYSYDNQVGKIFSDEKGLITIKLSVTQNDGILKIVRS